MSHSSATMVTVPSHWTPEQALAVFECRMRSANDTLAPVEVPC